MSWYPHSKKKLGGGQLLFKSTVEVKGGGQLLFKSTVGIYFPHLSLITFPSPSQTSAPSEATMPVLATGYL